MNKVREDNEERTDFTVIAAYLRWICPKKEENQMLSTAQTPDEIVIFGQIHVGHS